MTRFNRGIDCTDRRLRIGQTSAHIHQSSSERAEKPKYVKRYLCRPSHLRYDGRTPCSQFRKRASACTHSAPAAGEDWATLSKARRRRVARTTRPDDRYNDSGMEKSPPLPRSITSALIDQDRGRGSQGGTEHEGPNIEHQWSSH